MERRTFRKSPHIGGWQEDHMAWSKFSNLNLYPTNFTLFQLPHALPDNPDIYICVRVLKIDLCHPNFLPLIFFWKTGTHFRHKILIIKAFSEGPMVDKKFCMERNRGSGPILNLTHLIFMLCYYKQIFITKH